jgi:ribose transport system permease protein
MTPDQVATTEGIDRGAPEASVRGSGTRSRAISVLVRVIQVGPVLILALLWVAMTLASPYFLTTLNFSNLLQTAAVPAALAIGQLAVILTGGIDLSSGAVMVLASVVGAKFAHSATGNGALTIAAMLGTGTLVGLVNGFLIEWVRLGSAFVVTLGTLSVATGASYVVSNGATITGLPAVIDRLGGGYFGRIPIAGVVVLVLALLTYVLTARLRWGRWVYAIGGNREAASRAGMPVRGVSVSVFAFSGLAAAIAGIFTAGLSNSGAPTVSFTAELDAISAVVVGGAALTGGRGTIWGTVVGALILESIHNALNLLNVNTNWEPIVLGVVLLLAIGLERVRSNLETRLRLMEARLAGDL